MDNNNTMEYRIGLEKQNKRNDQVTELILDNCRASQISGLTDEFVNLETLSLINVGLVTLKGFPRLPKLKKLELSDNRLTGGLNLLHGSPKLQHLNISGNRIKDFEALEPLKEFHDLLNLDLYNCEVTKADDYRKKVFDLLPNLHSLDGYDRNEREVADSDESEDEGSDVENRITRDDNDLDDEDEDAEDEEQDSEVEGNMNNAEMSSDDDEDDDDDDDDDDDGEDFDEDDDDDEEEDIGLNSSNDVVAVGSEEPTRDDANDDDVQEIIQGEEFEDGGMVDGEEGLDDEEDEEEDEDGVADASLAELQKDNLEEDSDDDDFAPTHEADERDHEIDSEDDDDSDENEQIVGGNSGRPSSKLDATSTSEADTETRGQKRKYEDEGGDEAGGDGAAGNE